MCVGVGACVSPWFSLSVVETQSVEKTIVGQNMQIFHSLRLKRSGMVMAGRLISIL
mgnify:CR=1 FL=1